MNAVFQGLIAAAFLAALMSLSLSASAHDSPVITLENADQVVQLLELDGHEAAIYTVAWSPDGKTIASGSQDSTVRLWNAETGELIRILEAHGDAVRGIAWSPDGMLLASASRDGTVRLWESESGEERTLFQTNAWTFRRGMVAGGDAHRKWHQYRQSPPVRCRKR